MEQKEFLELEDFIRHFEIHWRLFLKRYIRYKELEASATEDNFDYSTYFDMLIVQVRAMCIESANLKNNYTIQNLMRKIAKDELAKCIDDELEKPLLEILIDKNTGNPMTLKRAIKILADGFICHYDNFDGGKDIERGLAIAIESNLKNPFNDVNLHSLVKVLIECINKGFFE